MSALEHWAGEVSELFHVDCRFECRDFVSVHDEALADHLYRLAQEAVTNAIKHGRAKKHHDRARRRKGRRRADGPGRRLRLRRGFQESVGPGAADHELSGQDDRRIAECAILAERRDRGEVLVSDRRSICGGEYATNAATAVRKRRVFIVDDHPIVRQGLALLINREPDLAVCGDAEEAGSALRRIEELKPDLVVVDISLNGPDGLDLLKSIRARDREFAGPDSIHAR